MHSVCLPRKSLLGTIEIASSLIGKVRIENDDSNKDQFLLEKPDDYSRRDSQEVSAELNKSDVYSRGNGSNEYLFKKPDVYSRRDNQEVSTELDESGVYSRRSSPTKFLFTEPVRSQKTEHEKVITDDEVRKDDLRKEVDSFEFPGVDPKFRKPLADLIFEYILIFASSSSELGSTDLIKHTIDTQGRGPIRLRPYRIHVKYRDIVIKLLAELKAAGIIEESISAWAAPVVIVIKKNGEIRVCVDYRKLNSITKKDSFPMPRIDDTLDKLYGKKFFSTLDLASGYYQIELEESAKEKTAFVIEDHLYQFARMPFGLCNGPPTFQRLMNYALRDVLGKKKHWFIWTTSSFFQTLLSNTWKTYVKFLN